MGYSKEEKAWNKKSEVLETTITKVKRGRDGAIISVGMKTLSGKILKIEHDKKFAGGMKAFVDYKGSKSWAAIPIIFLKETNKK